MKKRLLSIITATAMTLSAVPFVVSAETTEIPDSTAILEEEKESIVISKDGKTLEKCKISAESYVIPDGIEIIGTFAFHAPNLNSVIIPDSVKTIEGGAFELCKSLKEITIPKSVENVDLNSFQNYIFEKITFENPNCFIPYDHESDCWSVMPYNTVIYGYCNSTAQYYAEESYRSFVALDPENEGKLRTEPLIISDGTRYSKYPIESTAEIYKVPDGVTWIDRNAFKNAENLKEVILPEELEHIGHDAFVNCPMLKEVTIPKNAQLDWRAFGYMLYENEYGIFGRKIEDFTIKGYADSPAQAYAEENGFKFVAIDSDKNWKFDANGVLTISKGDLSINEIISDFPNKELIKHIIIEEGITEISAYAFSGIENVETINLPNTLTDIGDYAFLSCNSLKNINIPSSVKNIGDGAFRGCNSLEEIVIENPMCIIFDSNGTISNIQLLDDEYKYNGVIRGLKGSTAEIYAKTYGIEFAEIKTESIKGDANCDGNVNMADAVLIMQSLANPDKYGVDGSDETHITEQGIANGDMDGNGLTNADALEIQKKILKLS